MSADSLLEEARAARESDDLAKVADLIAQWCDGTIEAMRELQSSDFTTG